MSIIAGLLLLWSLGISHLVDAGFDFPGAGMAPVVPREDSWYTEPADLQLTAPGSILRFRPAPGNLTAAANASSAWNILFRTTDSRYRPTWAVTTLLFPHKQLASGPAMISYQVPYDSADIDASPSYVLANGSSSAELYSLMTGSGYMVNIPDYEGPLAAFASGVMSGHATVDSVRASLAFLALSGAANATATRYALWGYSGGALASEWACELAPRYAAEMRFAGAALGGLTPNVTSVLAAVSGQAAAGLVPSSFLGMTAQWPDVRARLTAKLHPQNASEFLAAETMTAAEAGVTFAGKHVENYFVDGWDSLLTPDVRAIIDRDGIMGYHGVPDIPVFAYKAVQDEVSPVADTDRLLDRYCDVGATIWYRKNTIGSHADEALAALPAVMSWLSGLLDGTAEPMTGCRTEEVALTVNGTMPPTMTGRQLLALDAQTLHYR